MKRIKKLVLVTGAALALTMSLSGCYYLDVEMTANDHNSLDNAMVKIYFATDYTNCTPDINVDGHGYELADERDVSHDISSEGLGGIDPYVSQTYSEGDYFEAFDMRHCFMENPNSTASDHLLYLHVAEDMTVEDIYQKSGIAQQQMYSVAQQYKDGSSSVKSSIIDKYAPRYELTLHFKEPVYTMMGDQYVTVSGKDCVIDVGQAMKDGGANIAVISSADKVKTNHDYMMKRVVELCELSNATNLNMTVTDPTTGAANSAPVSGGFNGNTTGNGGATTNPGGQNTDDGSNSASKPLDFTDVDPNAWYYNAVKYAVDKSVMNGYGDKKFGPNDPITFAQLAQIMYNNSEDKEVTDVADLHLNHWANTAMSWAMDRNLFLETDVMENGKVDTNLINKALTREQAISVMALYAGLQGYLPESTSVPTIPDLMSIDAKYRDNVKLAYQYGITNGVDANHTFSPKSGVTRAQMCQMFYNMGW